MKKSKYLGKYDFIAYFTKQPAFWFFSNAEVNAAIEAQYKLASHGEFVDDFEEEEDDEDEDWSEARENDYYSLYKELKDEYKNIDENNPQIVEGLIIDKKSREFITSQYPQIDLIVDLEGNEFKNKTQEELSILTQYYLENNKNIILFQPVFINGSLITKPDALVKQDYEIRIIETKGTTTAKRHHFLDIYFQSQVINGLKYLDDFVIEYSLCLVKYCYANKGEVPLVITDDINITKSVSFPEGVTVAMKAFVKEGHGPIAKTKEGLEYVDSPMNITKLCDGNFSDVSVRAEAPRRAKTCHTFRAKVEGVINNFYVICQALKEIKESRINSGNDVIDDIVPHANEKSYWKNSDLWLQLRSLYQVKGYRLFNYSGNIMKQTEDDLSKYSKSANEFDFIKKPEYTDYFCELAPAITINKEALLKMWSELKDKKVYFDFETINSPIRPIDDCLPFMQILSQCSVIIDNNDGTPVDQLKCNNIVIDPKHIDVNLFKGVVDALYKGSDYSYIVYNANFERSRLLELKNYFDSSDDDYLAYCAKIDCIVANLYDIANYFDLTKKKYGSPVIIKKLGGFYSIKKVLPYIMENYPDIYHMTGCKDYHDLHVVQNGKICQNETTKRFHDKLTDEEWHALEEDLKIYCENDVRAMIAVEYFIKELVKQYQ